MTTEDRNGPPRPRTEGGWTPEQGQAVKAQVADVLASYGLRPPDYLPIDERRRRSTPRNIPMIMVGVLAGCVTLLLVATIAAMAYAGAPVSEFVDLVKWAMLSVAIPAGAAVLKKGQG